MPNPLELESLKVLLNPQSAMRANDPVKLAGIRQQRLQEMSPYGDPRLRARLETDIAEDPFTGEAAQTETADQDALRRMLVNYNRPDVSAMRNEELSNMERLATAPARVAGQFRLDEAKISNAGAEDRFNRQQETIRRGQDLTQARAEVSQQGQGQRQRNTVLEAQAKKAEAEGPSQWNPLRALFGSPSGADQAATLRGQQQFGQPEAQNVAGDASTMAEAIRAQFPGQSFQSLIENGAVDVSDASDEEIAALLASE